MTDDGWEDKKEGIEEGVKDFPENAANWTGEKVRSPLLHTLPTLHRTKCNDTNSEQVGEAEQIPENVEEGFDRFGNKVEDGWDNTVDNVEDFPENAAEWTGEKVGAVESFGDDMGDAYDAGEAEGRSDDW